jgi:serine protease Do
MRRSLFFALLGTAGLLGGSAIAAEEPKKTDAPDLAHQLNDAFVRVFEKVAPAVVVIDSEKKAGESEDEAIENFDFLFRDPKEKDSRRHFDFPQQPAHSEASGFIVRPDGCILTNNHAIEDADKIDVRLKDGRHFAAKVLGRDTKTDIAVIKIDATGLPTAPLRDSDSVKVGEMVCAIGVPFALDYSFTCGWVSAKGRTNLTNTTYEDYIQTDAFINPGNSGGPLFDLEGRVIGMNTLINGIGRGLAFAIPSNMLRDVGDQLIATGKIQRPWLGLRIADFSTRRLRDQIRGIDKGVVVQTISADTPAAKSDLREADVIVAVDGAPLATAHDLQKEILKKKIGQQVELTVWRGGKTLKIPVKTAELPAEPARLAVGPIKKNAGPKSDLFGLKLQDLNKELAAKFELKSTSGAVIADVAPTSVAAAADIQRGDVITDVDQQPVADAAACRKLLGERDADKDVLLFLDRKGHKTYAVLKSEK